MKKNKQSTKNKIKSEVLYALPKGIAHKILYYLSHHKRLNYGKLDTYDEKIHYLIAKKYDKSYSVYADKIKVREYISSLGLDHILTRLYKVYEHAEEISIAELPDSFVMKTNNGCGKGCLEIVPDKAVCDEGAVKEKFAKALSIDFGKKRCEYHYSGIKPMILCEEYLKPQSGHDRLDDYKIVCNYGVPKAVLVCSERTSGRDYFDPEWNYLEYVKVECRAKDRPEKPELLDDMLKYAQIISKPFPLARIDFYQVNGKVFFGEITLTPSGGYQTYLTEYGQTELGRSIEL